MVTKSEQPGWHLVVNEKSNNTKDICINLCFALLEIETGSFLAWPSHSLVFNRYLNMI